MTVTRDHPTERMDDELARDTNPLIRKLERYAVLSASDRAALARMSTGTFSVEPSTDLVREGEILDAAYLVLSGFACRYKLRSDGARQITNYLVPGDICEVDTVPGVMNHSIGTLSSCLVARVPRELALDIVGEHPAIARALRISSHVDEATLREWLMNIGRRSAEERIAHLFCELSTRMRAVGLVQNESFKLPLTQFDLGDTIGLSYVHVNRTLQSLRQQGLITLRGRTLTVLDPAGLRALAEFKPGYLHCGDLPV